MNKESLLVAVCLVVSCFAASTSLAILDSPGLKSRSFEFKYGASICDVPKEATVRVWFPIAESNGQQKVTVAATTTPSPMQKNRDVTYRNLIGFFELKPKIGEDVKFQLTYDVIRQEAGVDDAAKRLTAEQKKLFLSANSLVPIDGKPQELIKEVRVKMIGPIRQRTSSGMAD